MVKGVNKQIIEINDTGSRYFERVLFFVAPGRSDTSEDKLQNEAKEYLLKLTPELKKTQSLRRRCKRKTQKKLLILGGIMIFSVAAAIILFNIL